MAQKEPETGPSLELPSLFGRRKRHAATKTSGGAATEHEPGDTTVQDRVAEGPPSTLSSTPPSTPTTGSGSATSPQDAEHTEHAQHTEHAAGSVSIEGGRRAASTRSVPELAASTAAILVGAVVGLLGCLLTLVGLQGCELVTGTDSCGGPGLLVLVVILVVMVLAGTVALRVLRVPEPGNVSFLGVGIMTAVALLFLIEYLYDPWMFLVVPMVTAITFALARWITTMYADDLDGDDGGMPHVDIR